MFSARCSGILLASALALAPSATAAVAQPSPDPVPVPYPLTTEVRAAESSPTGDTGVAGRVIPCIPLIKCLLKGTGTLQLQASPGESGGKEIEVLAWSWGAVDSPPAGSADPQEGGEVVRDVDSVGTAQEGSRKGGTGNVVIRDVTTKKMDKSSPVLMSTRRIATKEPGKLEVPNLSVAPDQADTPPPSGMVTMLVPAGTCVQGAHYSTVTLQSEGQAYELHDVTVAECAPASVARGKNAEKQKLQYFHVQKGGWDIKANPKL